MPNLLSVNSYHYIRGGSDAMYFSHAKLFEEMGWTNSFFSMAHPKNIPCETEQYFADRIDYDSRQGIAQTLVDSSRIIYSMQAKSRLSKLLDARPANIAHYHCIYHHLSPSVLAAAKERGIPTVITAHELKLACPAYKMMNDDGVCERCKGGKVWNVALHKCIKGSRAASTLIMVESAIHKSLRLYDRNLDRIVTPSKFYREKLIEWGWAPEKLIYIPNFIADIPEQSAPVGDYFLYFGRLAPEKGLETLIKAAAAAKVPVKIAGTGPELEALTALAERLAAPVDFVGFQSGDALWTLVDGAKAIVLPSEWYENGPMSVIEAFGRGKPLIGARIGGIPELIEENETGWSFTSGDASELATRLAEVHALPTRRIAEMAGATRDMVRSKFTSSAYFASISKVYGDLGVRS